MAGISYKQIENNKYEINLNKTKAFFTIDGIKNNLTFNTKFDLNNPDHAEIYKVASDLSRCLS